MKNTLAATALILTLCVPTVSRADVVAIGTPDCGTWINNPHPSWKAWLVGYLSGINAAIGKPNKDPLAKLSSGNQAIVWMDNYCRQNPLKQVSDGGTALYQELQNSKR